MMRVPCSVVIRISASRYGASQIFLSTCPVPTRAAPVMSTGLRRPANGGRNSASSACRCASSSGSSKPSRSPPPPRPHRGTAGPADDRGGVATRQPASRESPADVKQFLLVKHLHDAEPPEDGVIDARLTR